MSHVSKLIVAELAASMTDAERLAPEAAELASKQLAQVQSSLEESVRLASASQSVVSKPEPERLLTPIEAAERLGVTLRWLYRNAKRLPFTRKLTKRTLRFHEQGLAKYIREKRP